MVLNCGIQQIRSYFLFALFIGLVFVLGWIFWNLFIVAESSVGFTNRSSSGVSVYKITLDDEVIYDGLPKYHGPSVKPSEHAHYFGFFKPRGKLHMTVYFIDINGEKFTASHELDHRTGRCEFYCGIDNQHTLNCVCDDIFDFGH